MKKKLTYLFPGILLFGLFNVLCIDINTNKSKNISLHEIIALADGDDEEIPPDWPPPPWPPPPGQPIPPPDTIPPGTPVIYFDNN